LFVSLLVTFILSEINRIIFVKVY